MRQTLPDGLRTKILAFMEKYGIENFLYELKDLLEDTLDIDFREDIDIGAHIDKMLIGIDHVLGDLTEDA